jgi:hypothetical protein
MNSFTNHRIEHAKQKLREKLSFQYVKKLPAYKNITRAQYKKLIANIEVLSLVLLESFINSNH